MSPPPSSERDCKKVGPANLSLSSKLGVPGEGIEPNKNKGSDHEVEHADADEDEEGNEGDDQNDQEEDQGEQADDERDRCEMYVVSTTFSVRL